MGTSIDQNPVDLNAQYLLYLERIGLTEKKMHPEQRKQVKQAFFGACGQMLVLFRDGLGVMEESEAIKVMQNLFDQVGNYWLQYKGEHN